MGHFSDFLLFCIDDGLNRQPYFVTVFRYLFCVCVRMFDVYRNSYFSDDIRFILVCDYFFDNDVYRISYFWDDIWFISLCLLFFRQ